VIGCRFCRSHDLSDFALLFSSNLGLLSGLYMALPLRRKGKHESDPSEYALGISHEGEKLLHPLVQVFYWRSVCCSACWFLSKNNTKIPLP